MVCPLWAAENGKVPVVADLIEGYYTARRMVCQGVFPMGTGMHPALHSTFAARGPRRCRAGYRMVRLPDLHRWVRTDPFRQSMVTCIPSFRVRVAPMAPTITGRPRLRPTTAAWLPMPLSSVMTPAAWRR